MSASLSLSSRSSSFSLSSYLTVTGFCDPKVNQPTFEVTSINTTTNTSKTEIFIFMSQFYFDRN
jgi:hypothetical protein